MPAEDTPPKGKSALRSIATVLTGTISAQLIGILVLPLLSRVYGPSAFGVLAVFLAISTLVSLIAALRYEYAIVLPPQEEDAHRLRQLAIVIAAITSCLTLIATLVVFACSAPRDRSWWVLLIGVSVFIGATTTTLYFWMTRHRRYRAQSVARVVQATVTAGCQAILGVLVAPTGEWLIAGFVVGQLAGLATLAWSSDTRKGSPQLEWQAMKNLMVRYRKMPLLNAPTALVDSVRLNGINMIIGSRSLEALGQFSMGWKLASAPVGLMSNAISQVYLPQMATAPAGSLTQLVRSLTVRALLVGLVPAIVLAIVAPTLVPWVLGEDWSDTGLIVQALVPYLYMTIATSPLSNVFIITERQGTMFGFSVVYLIVPLTILLLAGDDLIRAVWMLSGGMTILLALLIGLTHRVAAQFDRARTDCS